MALSRVTPAGWVQESGSLSRVTPFGWVQESQSTTGASTFSFDVTTGNTSFTGSATGSSASFSFAVTAANIAFSGSATGDASNGTLTTPPLKNNTGTLLASETGATAYIYNISTGSLVVTKAAQTTNVSGVMTINDALIVAATQYRVVVVLGSGAEGMDKLTAT